MIRQLLVTKYIPSKVNNALELVLFQSFPKGSELKSVLVSSSTNKEYLRRSSKPLVSFA